MLGRTAHCIAKAATTPLRCLTIAGTMSLRHLSSERGLAGQSYGFVGLGKIGSGMVSNLVKAGAEVIVYDLDSSAVEAAVQVGASKAVSISDVAGRARVVISAVPNDKILNAVAAELLPALSEGAVHVSCSTVAPKTSRALAEAHVAKGVGFVAAPVFARPDGMRRGEATIPMSGAAWAKELARPPLEHTSLAVHDFGLDPGSASVVKLGGNFLIAAAIESMAEACALAESHNVDREQFMALMNTTIFDCLIYRGYGQRVASRDHYPHPDAHFALDLGKKDVALVHESAADANCPMPLASLLRDRFVSAQNAGRGKLDWSALALKASEEAGTDVSASVEALLASVDKMK